MIRSAWYATRDTASRAPIPSAAARPQVINPRPMPPAAIIARLRPSTAAVRNTRAVSRPGVIVSKPAAAVNVSTAWTGVMRVSRGCPQNDAGADLCKPTTANPQHAYAARLRFLDSTDDGRPRDAPEMPDVPRIHGIDTRPFGGFEDEGVIDLATAHAGLGAVVQHPPVVLDVEGHGREDAARVFDIREDVARAPHAGGRGRGERGVQLAQGVSGAERATGAGRGHEGE